MFQELKLVFQTHAHVERYETFDKHFAYKMEENSSASEHVLRMSEYYCRCQNRRISGRGSQTMHLRRMVIGGRGHDVYPGSGPLDGGNTLLPA